MMRTTNRGDVPAPHVARSAEKAAADPAEDVVFDAGSLSFVQDWVEGADGADATTEGELDRQDPRPSNPNRRLGVGAQPKKPKQERPEPSALEKKLLRKRQRQDQSDAMAGEMGAHGVTDGIDGEEGESKTASFKAKKKRERKQPASPPQEDSRPAGGGGEREDGEPTSVGGEGEVAKDVAGGDEGPGEKHGRKRKTKRKKRKAAAEETDEGAEDGSEIPQLSAAATAAAEGNPPAEPAADGGDPEEPEQGTKKQRRGWGKARSKTAAPAGSEAVETANAAKEGAAWERRSRKKVRSKQKNIRKDKRPVGERPAYLRAGDPEFCGRGLTDETRKFLDLPKDGLDNAPPAGWGQPGESPKWVNPSWVVDKKPSLIPEPSVSRGEGKGGEEPDSGVALEPRREVSPGVGVRPSGKSKYKNLALPPSKKSKSKKANAKTRRGSSGGARGEGSKPK